MTLTETPIDGLLIINPKIYEDARGFFYESYNESKFQSLIGKKIEFVQDNHSKSCKNVLRGIHLQKKPYEQAKLVRCIAGSVLDIAVDLRKNSSTFGKWFSIELSAENKTQLWIPEGFGHGFITLSETAEFCYKTTNYYKPESEVTLCWDDPSLNIDWQLNDQPVISNKDLHGMSLDQFLLSGK